MNLGLQLGVHALVHHQAKDVAWGWCGPFLSGAKLVN